MSKLGLKTLGIFKIDEVLPFTNVETTIKKAYMVHGIEYLINMKSLRYDQFRKSPVCSCCGLVGSYMALQIIQTRKYCLHKPHFNLYGIKDSKHIILTKDHILPKAKGGTDTLDNLQTMCYNCNQMKMDYEISAKSLKTLMIYYQFLLSQNYGVVLCIENHCGKKFAMVEWKGKNSEKLGEKLGFKFPLDELNKIN
jgi:hypothetical protein